MAIYYMIAGVDKTQTGSYDTHFDSLSATYNYAYLGISEVTASYFTWPVASRASSSLRDLQMYTPYPTGSERGKLYWVTTSTFITDPSLPTKENFVQLTPPPDNQYFIITPSLNNPSLATTGHIAIYAFADEADLFDNGWRSQRGTSGASNALATEANWNSLTSDSVWTSPPFSFDPSGTPGDKAKIVANILAYTETSYTLQNTLGLTGANLIKGAIVVAGGGTPFDNSTYRGIVPLFG